MIRVTAAIALSLLAFAVIAPALFDGESETLEEARRRAVGASFAELSLGPVHYQLGGPANGTKIALVHGFSTPLFTWDAVFEGLTAAGFRVLRYDLYGRGLSARPTDVDYNPDLYDRQLRELLQHIDWSGPIHLGGLSMGGAIIIEYAARHPDDVASLTLFDPAGFPIEMPFVTKLLAVPGLGEFLMRIAGDSTIEANLATNFHDPSMLPAFTERFRPQMKIYGFKNAQLSSMRHMPLGAMQERYRTVSKTNTPVLLFWGRQDVVVPFANAALIQEAIPQTKLVVIEECGHTPNYEKPADVLPPLLAFLKGQQR